MVREMDFVDECYADKDLSLLKKLTLVIPTYNRNYYLSRCLWYHAHFPFGQIIVADSSPEEKKVVNRETVAKVSEMFGADILYLEYEPETEKYGGDIYRKWGDAVMHVETEYSQICTDKEFVIPTTQIESIQYLEERQEVGVISGVYYSINSRTKTEYQISEKYSGRESILLDDALERYTLALSKGWKQSLLMSLYRSNIHKEIYNPIMNKSICDLRFGERYLEFAGYIFGMMHYLPDYPFNIRDIVHVNSSTQAKNKAESSTIRYPQMREYDKNSMLYQKSLDGFKKSLFQNLTAKYGYDVDILTESWRNIIEPIVTRDALNYTNKFAKAIIFVENKCPPQLLKYLVHVKHTLKNEMGNIGDNNVTLILKIMKSTEDMYKLDQPML